MAVYWSLSEVVASGMGRSIQAMLRGAGRIVAKALGRWADKFCPRNPFKPTTPSSRSI